MMEFERVIFMDNYFICDYRVRVRVGLELGLRFAYEEFERVIFMDNYFIGDFGLGLRFAYD